jgi:methanogenic corrinoid protein MtbC1
MTTDDWGDTTGAVRNTALSKDSSGKDLAARGTTARHVDPHHSARLRQTIETEIVPRLLAARGRLGLAVARSYDQPTDVAPAERHVASEDCLELQRLLLAHESTVAGAYVSALINQGVPRDEIYMELLAPVARGFGQLWDDDAADFTQITVALGRLQVLLHELGRDACESEEPGQGMRSALLMTMPGEQHTFGLLVIGDFFRRRGWNVCCEFPRTTREALELVANHHFDVVGVSTAGEQKAEELGSLLPALRRSSNNAALRILVGGPLLLRRPDLAAAIGADGTADSGEAAVAVAERLVEKLVEMH